MYVCFWSVTIIQLINVSSLKYEKLPLTIFMWVSVWIYIKIINNIWPAPKHPRRKQRKSETKRRS